MKKGLQKKALAILLTGTLLSSAMAPAVSADVYNETAYRGKNNILGKITERLQWTTNSSKITGSSAWQNSSGMFVNNISVTKEGTPTSTTHRYLFKNQFLVGFQSSSGATLGFSATKTDRAIIHRNGSRSWQPDI